MRKNVDRRSCSPETLGKINSHLQYYKIKSNL